MSDQSEVDLGVPGMEDAVEIGRGGFAVVYRARQPELNRTVAIKMLSARLDEPGREQFAREGWAMGALSAHPNIVSVFGTGTSASDRPYIAMAYLREGSLADRLDVDGPLPWAEAVRITVKLAGALETAHRSGTLHRDVKPENVLLSDYGEPELTDFGIARVEGRYETGTGQAPAVSAAHASPEVLEGRSASVSSDVYSLGSTLFSLLAGKAAFARRPDETLMALYLRIVRDAIPDLRPRGVPDAVCRVVEQAMDKEPGRRQTSAAELGSQLQEAQRRSGLPVTEMALALPDTAPRRAAPREDGSDSAPLGEDTQDSVRPTTTPRRLPWPVTAAVAVLAALVVFGIVVAWEGQDPQVATSGPGPAPTTTVAPEPPALDLPAVATGTDPTSVAVNPRTNRVYVANSGSLSVTVIDGNTRQVVATVPMTTRPQAVAVNQRSSRVYVTTAESSLVVINGDTDEVIGTIALTSRPGGLAIDHRTDRVFVALSDPSVAVIDGPSSRVVATIALAARPWSVALIPETNRAYVTSQDAGTLSIVDGSTYSVLATLPVGARSCGVATNPRSRRVYVTSQDAGTVTVVDADANTVVTTVAVGPKPCGVTVNSQSSRVYVTGTEAGTISVLDGNANQLLRARDVVRPVRAAEPLPYGLEVNPQTDGLYIVDRSANRLVTMTGDQL